jgi:trk/ktr system potassium uptake protein
MKFNDSALRLVLYIDGLLLLMLSAAMAVPIAVDYQSGNTDWMVFAASAALTTFVGGLLALTCQGPEARMDQRAGYLLTVSAWIVVGVFASLPLYFSTLQLTFTDAFFETMSGLTTTGSTVLTGLDNMPPGLLLWRSLLQWIGGIGIVVMAIVLLPVLRVGGMQLFRTESSDISGKPVPRLIRIAEVTVTAYVGLTIACGLAYRLAGMNGFDAINHAMTTIATGGYSTKDASIGFYNSVPIEIVGIVFMTAGAFPLIWYVRLFTHGPKALPHERQVPMFLLILLVATALLVAWNVFYNNMAFATALRVSAFNAASVLTDTGFATTDFSAWGSFAVGIFFVLLLVGGCAGSTAGAIKIFRWQILVSGAVAQLRRMISPRRIILVRYGDRPVDEEMTAAVRNFFFLYLSTLLVLSLLVMATGIDFLSSTTAVAQAMANAGPGLGRIGGPAGNFAEVPNVAKWLLVAAMLLGRLELSTVYVMLLSDFWKR